YVTKLKSSPNAELLSTRTPPVTNKRSFHPKRCWAYTPIVVFTSDVSTVGPCVEVPDPVSTPGPGNTIPDRKASLNPLRLNAPPTDDAEEIVGVNLNVAVP